MFIINTDKSVLTDGSETFDVDLSSPMGGVTFTAHDELGALRLRDALRDLLNDYSLDYAVVSDEVTVS